MRTLILKICLVFIICKWLQNPGEAILRFGDHGNKFYIILKGQVEVKLPDNQNKKIKLQGMSNFLHKTNAGSETPKIRVSNQPQKKGLTLERKFTPERNEDATATESLVFHLLKKFSNQEKATPSNNYVSLQSTLADLLQSRMREELIKKQEQEHQQNLETFTHAATLSTKKSDQSTSNLFNKFVKRSSTIVHKKTEEEIQEQITKKIQEESNFYITGMNLNSIKEMLNEDATPTPLARFRNQDPGFFTVATLSDGHAFGELALLNHKPRMATVRCLTKTHLMVLTKDAFDQVIAKIERRVLNEKLNFFSELPMFSLLTKNQLQKMIYLAHKIQIQKNMHLYKEGDDATSVYINQKKKLNFMHYCIVINGELEVTKKNLTKKIKEEPTKSIFLDPKRAKKRQNSYFSKNVLFKNQDLNVSMHQLLQKNILLINLAVVLFFLGLMFNFKDSLLFYLDKCYLITQLYLPTESLAWIQIEHV